MAHDLKHLYELLDDILPRSVSYSKEIKHKTLKLPFIVYTETNKKPLSFVDNKPILYIKTLQITLITVNKDTKLEQKLEKSLIGSGFYFTLLTEYMNDDHSINRVYEIKMEEYING